MSAPQAGDYVEDRFLAGVVRDRSTIRAFQALADACIPQLLQFAPGPRGLDTTAIWNWHEGAIVFTLASDGTLLQGEYDAQFDRSAGLDEDRPGHIRVRHKAEWLGYTYVGNAAHAIARLLVVGRYRDAAEAIHAFEQDGTLDAPCYRGSYEIVLDHVFGKDDLIVLGEGSPRKVVAFRWIGGQLALYHVVPSQYGLSWGDPDYSAPAYLLTPLRE
jgi:hypothetical protein